MSAPRALFFDIGDTLVFDEPPLRERLWQATQAVGLRFDRALLPAAFRLGEDYSLARYVQGIPWDDSDVMRESVKRILRALDIAPPDDVCWAALGAAFASIPFRRVVHPDAISLLEELRGRGFVVGAISDWEETLPELLAELALAPHLDALAVSALVGVTKPDPRLFQEALRQAQVGPEESLHVGDYYELDIAGARAAEMEAVLFDWKERVPDADCPRVETFAQLVRYLRALPDPTPALGHPSPLRGEGLSASGSASGHGRASGHGQTAGPDGEWPLSISEWGGVAEGRGGDS